MLKGLYRQRGIKDHFAELWRSQLEYNMSIGCFANGGGFRSMIALSILYPATKSNDEQQNLVLGFNVFENYRVKKFLASAGMVVVNCYRNNGFGKRLLNLRRQVCKDNRIKVTSSVFTSPESNKISDDLGYEENAREP